MSSPSPSDMEEYIEWEADMFYLENQQDKIRKEDSKFADLFISCDRVSPFFNFVSCDKVQKLYDSITTSRANGDNYYKEKKDLRILHDNTFRFLDS